MLTYGPARTLKAIVGLIVCLAGILLGLISCVMILGLVLDKDIGPLLFVFLATIALSPPLVIAGIHIALDRPNEFGLVFSPNFIRLFGAFYGIFGAVIFAIALRNMSLGDLLKAIGLFSVMVSAFVLASSRTRG